MELGWKIPVSQVYLVGGCMQKACRALLTVEVEGVALVSL